MKSTLTDETALLQAALEGLELQKTRLDQQIIAVRTRLGIQPKRRGRPPKNPTALASLAPAPVAEPTPGKRDLSPAARKRIAEAQKKRWAEHRKAKAKAAAKKPAAAEAEEES